MDDLTPMEPSFQEQPPKPVQPPDHYGTGKHPTRPKAPLALIALLLTLLLTANLIAFAALLRLWGKDTVQSEQPSNGLSLLSPSPTEAGTVDPDRPDVMPIDGEQTALTLPELYRKVRDCIAVVTARTGSGQNTGSGVILDTDGYLLTNAHTVNGALRLEVTLSDGTDYAAAFVGMDSDSDLAVLKISAENLTAAEFGSADGLSAGDGVVILSNPFGKELAGTMTEATVAAVNEDVSVSGLPMRVLQISASGLNDGSGVVVNYSGQIIGIGIRELGGFTSFDNDAGVGFALPAQEARGLVNDLVAFGSVEGKATLGIEVAEIARPLRIYWQLPEGVLISRISRTGTAYLAGLRLGDVLLAIGDSSVASLSDYVDALGQYKAGDTVRVTIYRDGKYYYADILLDEAG